MMMTSPDPQLAATFDLRHLDAAFYADPYPTFDALRSFEPVRRMPDGSVFLSRYADVMAVYKDPKTFSSDKHEEFAPKYGDSPLFEHHTTSLVFNDPPLHTRVRRLMAGALTPRHIGAMEDGLVAPSPPCGSWPASSTATTASSGLTRRRPSGAKNRRRGSL